MLAGGMLQASKIVAEKVKSQPKEFETRFIAIS